MQMVWIKEERWIIRIIATRWYLKFNVFVRNIFLVIIHATEKGGIVRTQGTPKQERGTHRTTLIS